MNNLTVNGTISAVSIAGSGFWDADGNTTTDTGGSGVWDAASPLWRADSAVGALQAWPNASGSTYTAQLGGTAGTLTLNSSSVNITNNNITFGTAGYTIAPPASGTAALVLAGASPTINVGTVGGTIACQIAGVDGLTKSGSGTLVFSGANTYTGGTLIGAGTLQLGNAGTSGSLASTGIITNHSILAFNRSDSIAQGTDFGSLTGTGRLTKSAAGTVTLTAANLLTNTEVLTFTGSSAGTVVIKDPAALGPATNAIRFSAGGSGNLDLQLDGAVNPYKIISGSGNGGTLTIGRATSGAGLTQTLGVVDLSSVTLTVNQGANIASGSAGVAIPEVNMSGGNDNNPVTITGTAAITITNAYISLNGISKRLQLDGTSASNKVVGSISNGIAGGVVNLIKAGSGTWTLSGSNTYTGTTTVNQGKLSIQGGNGPSGGTINKSSAVTINGGGTLSVDALNAIGGYNAGNAPTITVNSGGTLTSGNGVTAHVSAINLAGGTLASGSPDSQWGSWTLDGAVTVTANSIITATNIYCVSSSPFNVNSGVTLTLQGNLADVNNGASVATLVKQGSGTMTLTAASGYTGSTTIGAGTLALSGSGSIAHSASITIATNATLDISAVTGPGYANPAGRTLAFSIDKTGGTRKQGQLVIGGINLAYDGSLTVTKSGSDALVSGDSFALVSRTTGTLSGWFSSVSLPVLDTGLSWDTNHLATAGRLDVYSFTTTALEVFTPKNSNVVVSASKLSAHAGSSLGAVAAVSASLPGHGSASISGGSLTYSPAADYVGSDAFTVTFSDGHGIQTMTVNVAVGTSSSGGQSPNVLMSGTAGGEFYVLFAGKPNTTYTVETNAAPSGGTWVKYDNFTAGANGLINVTNVPTVAGELYFRTAWPSY